MVLFENLKLLKRFDMIIRATQTQTPKKERKRIYTKEINLVNVSLHSSQSEG